MNNPLGPAPRGGMVAGQHGRPHFSRGNKKNGVKSDSASKVNEQCAINSSTIAYSDAVNEKWKLILKKATNLGCFIVNKGLRACVNFNEKGLALIRYSPECDSGYVYRFRFEHLIRDFHPWNSIECYEELNQTFATEFRKLLDFHDHLKSLAK